MLITGTVDLLVTPLASLFDEVVASRLHTRDGRFSGFLESPPLVGEARAAWLRRYAATTGVELADSYAYGDSSSDRPLLEAVGHPVAVNPTRTCTATPGPGSGRWRGGAGARSRPTTRSWRR